MEWNGIDACAEAEAETGDLLYKINNNR